MRAVPARALLAAAIVAAAAAAATPAAAAASDALNGRVAYTTHGLDGTGEIVTIDPDGSDWLRLTDHRGYDAQSDWSPDGRSIVFRRSPALTGFEVWRMTAEGKDETRMTFGLDLATGAYSSSQPAWAPDGERILFRASGGPYNPAPVFTIPNVARAEKTLLLQAAQPLWYPQLSPDGTKLLVAVQYPRIRGREDRAVEIADLLTAPVARHVLFDGPKTAPGVYDSAGNWSPDGTRVAFESDVDGDMDIYVIGADGTGLTQLTGVEPDDNAHDEGPSWSPDGLKLAFTSGPDNLNGDIHVMDAADGSDVRRITTNEGTGGLGRDESPDWQGIPIGEDLRPLGDLVAAGTGAYSVHAGGGLRDARALRLARRWSRLAAHGIRLKVLAGLRMRLEEIGPGAVAVRGTPVGRDTGRRLAFVFRED